MMILLSICLVAINMKPCMSDLYMHFPPGSNNRLNGAHADVTNNNRLFDSQNNDKCGYNVGEKYDIHEDTILERRQEPIEFYMSGCSSHAKTEVDIMWTNQHGTGPKTDDRVETQVILQFMCQPFPGGKMHTGDADTDYEFHTIRNGQTSGSQTFADQTQESSSISKQLGLHEPHHYYQAYYRRYRNKGLFTADQQLAGDLSIYTRQNAAGTIRGLEVPEERDYYPYWGPTPWKDIAILVSNEKTEELMMKYVNSSQYGLKYMCIMPKGLKDQTDCPPDNQGITAKKCVAKYITKDKCKAAGGDWTRFITNYLEKTAGVLSTCHGFDDMKLAKGVPYEAHKISQGSDNKKQYVLLHRPPDVMYAPSTVVNHNGINMEGKFSSYRWKVPCFPSNTTQRCVIRIRYNITTSDAPRDFNAKDNHRLANNPTTKAVDNETDLQLALNTAQVGRTFQDRSHVFIFKPRNLLLPEHRHRTIRYIGGIGKRGNIVQTYPAMEYRFFPERITVTTEEIVCFVWSGSNNNPHDYAGQGAAGTDRTNVCWIKEGCKTLAPKSCGSLPLDVVDYVDEFDGYLLNLHLNWGCLARNKALDDELNNAPPSCNPPCFRIKKPGKYCYMGTRNNNFSNRRHIGQITVTSV
ncbi:protein DD3-3-like [Montipora foliosa]|uniref:protein DD3-3-like n=1 Tax=Montipora foliosa TaxID=591990 RepID=UPI0035F110CE